jgi:diadenosine tetraphosphate (Ap4A) HIT family hydrolase
MKNDIHDQPACPFCIQNESLVILANDHALAIPDGFPATPGYTLIRFRVGPKKIHVLKKESSFLRADFPLRRGFSQAK